MKKSKLMLDDVETLIFKDFDEYVDFREDDEQLNGCDQSFLDDYYKGDYIKWYKDNENNTSCWNCLRCDGCHHCDECIDCDDCEGCISCTDCTDCTDCEMCDECEECDECNECVKCVNCGFATDLRNRKDYDPDYDNY